MFSLAESLCHVVAGTVHTLHSILCVLDFVCCLDRCLYEYKAFVVWPMKKRVCWVLAVMTFCLLSGWVSSFLLGSLVEFLPSCLVHLPSWMALKVHSFLWMLATLCLPSLALESHSSLLHQPNLTSRFSDPSCDCQSLFDFNQQRNRRCPTITTKTWVTDTNSHLACK